MRKALTIALGLATLGALAGMQPAAAGYVRCINHWAVGIITQPQDPGKIVSSKLINGGFGERECFYVDKDQPLKPTTPWKGSVAGFGKSIPDQKTIRLR